jgi:hypothetical protein
MEKIKPPVEAKSITSLPTEATLDEIGARRKDRERLEKRRKPPSQKVKGIPVPPSVTMLYLGRPFPGSRHQGIITVAMAVPGPGLLHLGIACCSPEDAWCKVTGRNLAIGRLLRAKPIVVPFLQEPFRIARQVVSALLNREFARLQQFGVQLPAGIARTVPGWAKKFEMDRRVYANPDFHRKIQRLIVSKVNTASGIFDEPTRVSGRAWKRLNATLVPRLKASAILRRMLADIAKLEDF